MATSHVRGDIRREGCAMAKILNCENIVFISLLIFNSVGAPEAICRLANI